MRIFILCIILAAVSCSAPQIVPQGLPYRAPLVSAQEQLTKFIVLVFKSDIKVAAERVTREVHLFQEMPVRLVFNKPYWQVTLGTFSRKLHALQICEEMVELGYPNAQIIPVVANNTQR